MNRKIYIVLAGMLCMIAAASAQVPISDKDPALAAKLEQQKARSGFKENKGQLLDQNGIANHRVKYLLEMKGLMYNYVLPALATMHGKQKVKTVNFTVWT
jgi:hypothetical protein